MTRRLSVQLMAGITLVLVVMLGANLAMVWRQQQQDLEVEMHGKAKVIADQLTATRLFMARNQDRINRDTAGHFEFKGLNPAAVGRGVGSIFGEITEVRLKQTRFQVRRPENAPDEFELEALKQFEADPELQEYYRRVMESGKPVFRYARPMRIENECLRCHGGPEGDLDVAGYQKEGYREGDLGGAISVALPMEQSTQLIRNRAFEQVWVIVGVTGASLLVIWLLSRRLVTKPLEQLAVAANRIGAGQLALPATELAALGTSQELQALGSNMESMVRNLREVHDSLEQKVAERTAELQVANQAQGQLLATVSHELRTPLTSIIAFTELLRQRATGKDLEYLDDVLESSRRLLDTVNNLLDLNRLKAGRVELFADLLELPPLLTSVQRTLQPLACQKQIILETCAARGLPLVLMDPHRISQVLYNLIGNAIKFTPEGGRILVSAAHGGGWVVVSVQDNGPGVPREHRESIFEAFRRIEGPGNQQQGTGLGLALARELVELHGGSLWLVDLPEGGSIFRFTLPEARHLTEEDDADHGDETGPRR